MGDSKERVISELVVRDAKILFDHIDKDGDGVVDATDFLTAFPSLLKASDPSEEERFDALKKAKSMIDGVDKYGMCDVAVEGQMRFPEFLRVLVYGGFFDEENEKIEEESERGIRGSGQ